MSEEAPKPSSHRALIRTLRNAFLLLLILLAAIALWVWISSGSAADLPFEYGGFD